MVHLKCILNGYSKNISVIVMLILFWRGFAFNAKCWLFIVASKNALYLLLEIFSTAEGQWVFQI